MADLTPLQKLKIATKRVVDKCPDKGAWDKWARRFLMGIDNTVEAASKALKANDVKYAAKFPPKEVSVFDYVEDDDEYPDVGGINLNPSYSSSYTNTPNYSISGSDPDEEEKPSIQQIKNHFIARSSICRAVVSWGEWTMEKAGDPARDDLLNEMEIELSQADGAISEL